MLGTSPVSSRWIASRIASARALKAASDLSSAHGQHDSVCTRRRARAGEHERKGQKRENTHLWWSFSPRSTSTWRVTPAACANDWNTCGIISVERSPIFSRFSCRSPQKYGREEMSRTARARACTHSIRAERTVSITAPRKDDLFQRKGTHLVERGKAGAIPPDASPFTERELERLADRERAVLRRVVVVDFQVALALDLERHAAVLGESVEHLHRPPRPEETIEKAQQRGQPRAGARRREKVKVRLTWFRNPMPVLISMTCLASGAWSRVMLHWMSVSPVLRETLAVRMLFES